MEQHGKSGKKVALMHAKDIKIEEYIPSEISVSNNNDSVVIL